MMRIYSYKTINVGSPREEKLGAIHTWLLYHLSILPLPIDKVAATDIFMPQVEGAYWFGPVHPCVCPLHFAYGQERLEIQS